MRNFFNTFALLYFMSKGCENVPDPHSVIINRNGNQLKENGSA